MDEEDEEDEEEEDEKPAPKKKSPAKKVIVKKVENNSQFLEIVRDFEIDLIITVAYGHILKDELLHLPKYGCINLHYSLLPKYRALSPTMSVVLSFRAASCVQTRLPSTFIQN